MKKHKILRHFATSMLFFLTLTSCSASVSQMPRIKGNAKSFIHTTEAQEYFNKLSFEDKDAGIVSAYLEQTTSHTYANLPYLIKLKQTSTFVKKSGNWYLDANLQVKHGAGNFSVNLKAAERNRFFYFTIKEKTNGKFVTGTTDIYNAKIESGTYIMPLQNGYGGTNIINLIEAFPFLGLLNTQKLMSYVGIRFANVKYPIISLDLAEAKELKLVETDNTFGIDLKLNLKNLQKSPYELVRMVTFSSLPHTNYFNLETTQKFNYHDVFTFEKSRVQAFGRAFDVAYNHHLYGENYKEKVKNVYKYIDKAPDYAFKNPEEIKSFQEIK